MELSEPRPEKGMVRIGWIICESGTDMTAALAAITDKRVLVVQHFLIGRLMIIQSVLFHLVKVFPHPFDQLLDMQTNRPD